MTDRIMLRAHANKDTVAIQTYAPRIGRSPQRFYVTYNELGRLQSDGSLLARDIHSFACIRLDERHDRITFEFTWLTGRSFGRVEGYEQTVRLRWSAFRAFLETCRTPDGPRDFKFLSQDASGHRPRLMFNGDLTNLKAAVGDPLIRRKLGKALMANFNWKDSEEVHLYNDCPPYSFFFREYVNDRPVLCGGLILHGQEDMSKAYYGIHT